jgi:hypothetical protein
MTVNMYINILGLDDFLNNLKYSEFKSDGSDRWLRKQFRLFAQQLSSFLLRQCHPF